MAVAQPAGRKKIAQRFIAGAGDATGPSPGRGRQKPETSFVPVGTLAAPGGGPSDKSLGYSQALRTGRAEAAGRLCGKPAHAGKATARNGCLKPFRKVQTKRAAILATPVYD